MAFTTFKSIVAVAAVSTLVACGGGSGGGTTPTATPQPGPTQTPTPTPTPLPGDVIPDPFTFAPIQDGLPNTQVTSDAVPITGFDGVLDVSANQGFEVSVNGGEFLESGSRQPIESGQTVQVRGMTPNQFDASLTVIVTVSGSDDHGTPAQFLTSFEGEWTEWEIYNVSRDITPDTFSLAPINNAPLNNETNSNSFVLAGINDAAPISIDNGSFSIDSGTTFISDATTVDAGATIVVRLISGNEFNETVTANLTVGVATQAFSVTTFQPDAITFESTTNTEPSSEHTSEAYTLTGITGSAPISIANGSYRLGDTGDFVTTDGTLNAGDSVYVRIDAAATASTDATATLTIGNVQGTYTVTTIADTEAPVITVAFPPENSMTEANTVRVRGKTTDWSEISTVSISNGETNTPVITDDNYATWYADVTLTEGANTLTVVASDEHSNTDDDAGEARVTYDPASGAFPDSNVQVRPAWAMAYDPAQERLLISGALYQSIVAVDLVTGARSPMSDSSTPNSDGVAISSPQKIFIPPSETPTLAYVSQRVSSGSYLMYTVNLENGERTIFSDVTSPNTDNPLVETVAIIESPLNENQLLIGNSNTLLSVARSDGARSTTDFPTTDTDIDVIGGLTGIPNQTGRLYVQSLAPLDSSVSGIYSWDFENDTLTPFSTNTTHPSDVQIGVAFGGIVFVEQVNKLFVSNNDSVNGLISINPENGDRELLAEENNVNDLREIETLVHVDGEEYIFTISDGADPDVAFQDIITIHAVDVRNGNKVVISQWVHES